MHERLPEESLGKGISQFLPLPLTMDDDVRR